MVIRALVEGKMVFWQLMLLLLLLMMLMWQLLLLLLLLLLVMLLRLEEKVDLGANEVELVREIDTELRFQLPNDAV